MGFVSCLPFFCLFIVLNCWRWIEEVEEAEMLFKFFSLKWSSFDCEDFANAMKFGSFGDLNLVNENAMFLIKLN
jgi:hypothetical protein